MKRKINSLISKGFSKVKENDKRLGTNMDCRRCRYDLFGECKHPEATVYDYVVEYGRTYCCFFEER